MKKGAFNNLKIKSAALVILSAGSLVGCGGNSPQEVVANVKFWSADTNYKIVSDRGYDYYQSAATDASLKYRMGQGEYESAQIIMTPDADVKNYDVKISDIKDNKGNSINKNKVKIYAQKYVKVSGIYDTETGETPGYFPDPLLPFEASKKYNENKISKDKNQAIYVSIESDLNQIPGTYNGTITITVDGKENNFPIEVEVLPIQINEVTHSNSIFLNHWNYQFQELNGSQEMLDKYTEACIDYRLGTDRIVINHNDADMYMDYYVEKAYQYMQNPRYPTCIIPYKETYSETLQATVFDTNVLKNYIRAYFDKSCETGFNMFTKSRLYLAMIDEPEETGRIPLAIAVSELYKQTITEIADELETRKVSNPLHDELVESVRNLLNVVTNKYSEELVGHVDTWCPKVDDYNRSYDREKYNSQKEKWWYTCVYPRAPYPTYHTEDTITSAKLISWMQANYNVSGNLYWATNNYAKMENGIFQPIEDVYAEAEFADNINGDGFIFYPGGQYGLDSPVPSYRIEAIRDGLEEYELLYNLKQKYQELGANYQSLFNFLTLPLYYGTKVNATPEQTRNIRNELLDLCVLNNSGSNFTITNYENINDGKAKLTFFAKPNTTIKVDGKTINPSSTTGAGSYYLVTKTLADASNKIEIEVTYNGETTSYTHNFGGKVSLKDASVTKNGLKKYNSSVTANVVSGSSVLPSINYDVLKLDISAPKDLKQSIKYEPSFINEINNNTFGVSLEVINPYAENMEFSIGGKFSKRPNDTYLVENEMLKPGLNRLFVPMNKFVWNNYGSLSYLMFVFGNNNSTTEAAKTMYFGNISIINK